MDETGDILGDDCVEILVRSVTEPEDRRSNKEAQEVYKPTSFETLIRTALALEEDPRNEHSYAYSEKKLAFDGKEKDHCYSTISKYAHRKVQSLSDETIFRSSESFFPDDASMLLPQYRSKDSALDVTGFDTISPKCRSYENIDLKTVDVFTDKCILPGLSDPEISRMTLQSRDDLNDFVKTTSLPNSTPSKDKLVLDHTYSSYSKVSEHAYSSKPGEKCNPDSELEKVSGDTTSYDKSPLFDHSYDTSQKHISLPFNWLSKKRGRSNETINYFGRQFNLTSADFTKSPFLDHTYQSVELRSEGKRQNIGRKEHACNSDKIFVRMREHFAFPSQPAFLDHNYEQRSDLSVDDIWLHSRSNSTSATKLSGFKANDHSYVVQRRQYNLDTEDRRLSAGGTSDSGTESFNEEEEEHMSTTFDNLVTLHKDHAYVVTED